SLLRGTQTFQEAYSHYRWFDQLAVQLINYSCHFSHGQSGVALCNTSRITQFCVKVQQKQCVATQPKTIASAIFQVHSLVHYWTGGNLSLQRNECNRFNGYATRHTNLRFKLNKFIRVC